MNEIIKKNNTDQNNDDSLPVYEAEIISEEISPSDRADVSRRAESTPPAYSAGRIFGLAASFLFTVLKALRPFNTIGQKGRNRKPGQGKRFRMKRNRRDF
jgi:hypothetical protein